MPNLQPLRLPTTANGPLPHTFRCRRHARHYFERKAHQHSQATPTVVADLPLATGTTHQPLDDGEPQPAMAIAAARRIEPHERPAGIDQILRRNTLAVVAHR